MLEPNGTYVCTSSNQQAVKWIDVRIHTAHVDQPIGRDLLREELQKRRAYGQTAVRHPSTGPRHDPRGSGTAWPQGPRGPSHLPAITSSPRSITCQTTLSCILRSQTPGQLRVLGTTSVHPAPGAWQSLAECQPIPIAARPPNSSQLARPDSSSDDSSARLTGARPLSERP